MRSIPNVLRRGFIFHFRRAVPLTIRHKLRRTELTCSLKTSDTRTAKLVSRALYIASEHFFKRFREAPMLSDEQLTLIVGDFYETVIRQENSLRLNGQPLSEEARQARIAHYREVSERTKQSLGGNQFADAAFVSEAMLRKHKLAGTLKSNEINQVRQAILRAGIDLADHMKARYEGDFNYQPRDQLLKAQFTKFAPFKKVRSPRRRRQSPQVRYFQNCRSRFLPDRCKQRHGRIRLPTRLEKASIYSLR